MTAAVANWIHALYDIPWLYRLAYPLWILLGFATVLLLAYSRYGSLTRMMLLVWADLALAFGAFSIILSRPLAEGRDNMPTLFRYLGEGWSGLVDYGPSVFRMWGSGSVALAFGTLSWLVVPSLGVAVIVGLVAGLALWVWTWYLFPEMDD